MKISRPRALLICLSCVSLIVALMVLALDWQRALTPSIAYASGGFKPQAAPNAVTGVVYRDYNENGTQDAREPGVAGILVTAYNAAGAAIATATTGTDGTYSLSVPDGLALRIQFTNIPAGFQLGPSGPQSRTSVTFVTSPATGVSLGLNRPNDYCQNNPDLVTSCFTRGYQLTTTNAPAIVSFPYLSSGATPPPNDLANANQVGSTWGIAYQRSSNSVFAAAFLKRHSGFGPNGTGAIYRIDRANPLNVSLLVDLNVLFPLQLPGGINPRGNEAINDWFHDPLAFPLVGKIGLGDLDIFEDDATLYTVGLNDRALYRIPISTPNTTTRFPIPSPCVNATTDARPFGLGIHDGLVYVGGVCSGESSQMTTTLQAYIYTFDPATNTFSGSPVFSFPLTYPRRCVDKASAPNCLTNSPAQWNPWTATFRGNPPPSGFDGFMSFPQPWLTDIVFDNADMIIGLRDRYGDQLGNASGSTNPADATLYWAVTAGDILRACATTPNVVGAWTLENNGSCGGITTAGQNNSQGPGNGEYYFTDNFTDTSGVLFHDEVSVGGLAQLPGALDVAETVYDPIQNGPFPAGGVRWFNDTNGTLSRSYQVYSTTFDPGGNLFGKANGLGDLEAICVASPLELGNRVWFDTNGNGIQDAGEAGVANVTAHLYSTSGALLGTTTTNASGEYYFNNANVTGGIQQNTQYRIRLDNPADYTPPGPLSTYSLTVQYAGGITSPINSKGSYVLNYPEITVTTGGPDANEHALDFGFVSQQVTPTPTPTNTNTPTPTPMNTGTPTPRPTGTPSTLTPTPTPPPERETQVPTPTPTGSVTPLLGTATPTTTPQLPIRPPGTSGEIGPAPDVRYLGLALLLIGLLVIALGGLRLKRGA